MERMSQGRILSFLVSLGIVWFLSGCATPARGPGNLRGHWQNAEISFYCPCKICCGPNARGITASGARARVGMTLAAARSIPFDTRIWIPNFGWRVVQDRVSPKYEHRFDVFIGSHAEALRLGIRHERIFLEDR
jgi:3D (Asp-Asp-Asp) domain-containing protein